MKNLLTLIFLTLVILGLVTAHSIKADPLENTKTISVLVTGDAMSYGVPCG